MVVIIGVIVIIVVFVICVVIAVVIVVVIIVVIIIIVVIFIIFVIVFIVIGILSLSNSGTACADGPEAAGRAQGAVCRPCAPQPPLLYHQLQGWPEGAGGPADPTGLGQIGLFGRLICKFFVSYIFSGSRLGQQQEQEHLWRQLRDSCCEGRRDQGTVQDADDIRQDARDVCCRGHHISLQECHWNLLNLSLIVLYFK